MILYASYYIGYTPPKGVHLLITPPYGLVEDYYKLVHAYQLSARQRWTVAAASNGVSARVRSTYA